MNNLNIKVTSVWVLVIGVILAALLAIEAVLNGFSDIDFKVLMTILTIGSCSLAFLSGLNIYKNPNYHLLGITSMLSSSILFFILNLEIWLTFFVGDIPIKIILLLVILTFSTAYASVVLIFNSKNQIVKIPITFCISTDFIIAAILAFFVLGNGIDDGFPWEFLLILSILNLASAIISIILNKTLLKKI